jgi:hypothetical protein
MSNATKLSIRFYPGTLDLKGRPYGTTILVYSTGEDLGISESSIMLFTQDMDNSVSRHSHIQGTWEIDQGSVVGPLRPGVSSSAMQYQGMKQLSFYYQSDDLSASEVCSADGSAWSTGEFKVNSVSD